MKNLAAYSAQKSAVSPHVDFLPLYPVIQRHARVVFRHLAAVEREEAIAEAVAAGFVSFVRLKNRNKTPADFPSAIAKFAALHVKSRRRVGTKVNSGDIYSRSPGHRRDLERCQRISTGEPWSEFLADDSSTPVLDQVAFRLDWPVFLSSLSSRHQEILQALARGHSASWVAVRFDLSTGRITQLRQQWRRQWLAFIAETNQAPV